MNILEELEKLRLSHLSASACKYPCPKSDSGNLDSNTENKCICGAESHNRILDDIINMIRGYDEAQIVAAETIYATLNLMDEFTEKIAKLPMREGNYPEEEMNE